MLTSLRGIFRLAATAGAIGYYGAKIFLSSQKNRHAAFKDLIGTAHKIYNLKVNMVGVPANSNGALTIYVANHISNIDMAIIQKPLEGVGNVAAIEISKWPVFGPLAKSLDTVFVKSTPSGLPEDEKIKRATKNQQDAKEAVREKLRKNVSFLVFPQGKIVNPLKPLDFKDTIPDVLNESEFEHVVLQPVALEVTRVDGQLVPKGKPSELRERYARYATEHINPETGKKSRIWNKSFWQMIWDMATTDEMEFTLTFLPPIKAADLENKKSLANEAHALISRVLEIPEFVPPA